MCPLDRVILGVPALAPAALACARVPYARHTHAPEHSWRTGGGEGEGRTHARHGRRCVACRLSEPSPLCVRAPRQDKMRHFTPESLCFTRFRFLAEKAGNAERFRHEMSHFILTRSSCVYVLPATRSVQTTRGCATWCCPPWAAKACTTNARPRYVPRWARNTRHSIVLPGSRVSDFGDTKNPYVYQNTRRSIIFRNSKAPCGLSFRTVTHDMA